MEGSPSEHIGAADLAKLLEQYRFHVQPTQDAAAVHPHFADCQACWEQFEALTLLERQFNSLKSAESLTPHSDCPDPTSWRNIVGGLTPPDETLANIEHASRCDYCGPLLHGAVVELSELNGEITEAERRYIADLESTNAEWQHKLAHRITGTPYSAPARGSARWWQKWRGVPQMAMAGASLLAVIALGSWVALHRNQPSDARNLLARAYTEKRTLELRIAGADHAPLRVSLGPAGSFTDRPPALLRAEALIAGQLQSHPSDPNWLQAQAQADILEGKYDPAVEALRRSLELEPHSPALLIDLATAYFQRAQQEGRKEDFAAAYEYLSQALQLRPNDTVALFNRAIVAEHEFLYHQAVADWDRYLQVDPNSEWAAEARDAAERVRTLLKQHDVGQAAPMLSPTQIALLANSPSLRSTVDARIEQYLSNAVRSWLPQAYPEAHPEKVVADAGAQQALFFLADLTNKQHSDRWLSDLLRSSSAPHFPEAIGALARAVQATDDGNYDTSRQQADLAERLFRKSGNTAGELRAELEQSLADQGSRRGEDCRGRSTTAVAKSMHYSYPWVQIQLGLEETVCSGMMGDLGSSEKAVHRAQDTALQAGYGALYLRALGFVAESKSDTGDWSSGWRLVFIGLERYWSGQFPAMRGYNLYVEGATAAEAADQSNLRFALWREAAAAIDTGNNLVLRAEAHGSMALAASAANQPEVAEPQYLEAARLYALAPQSEGTRAFHLENELFAAQSEARQSAFTPALARLTSVQNGVQQLSNNLIAQLFYSTLGDVQLHSNHPAEAEQAYRTALSLAEQNLTSLTSEASRAGWSKNAAPLYLGLAEAELRQGREQDSLEVFEWYLGAPQRIGGRRHDLPPSLTAPSRLPARLPLLSNQTVLAFGVLPDGLAIWVYDNRGVSAKWIPKSPSALQDMAASFYAQCSNPRSELSALRRNSQTLYSQLIAPVEDRFDPKRTLVIEAEGSLARLPFEALMDSGGHYLIERESIVHSPGLYAEELMHSDTAISRDSLALVVGSLASSAERGLFAVPNIQAGVEKVAGGFRSPRTLQGSEATLEAIENALPSAQLFHFAGHAITTTNDTGLLLEDRDSRTGTPALLDADALRNLNLQNMQLAVLAACSTDSGDGGSRGIDSVAEILQTSGVPHVVASRWAVDSVQANFFVDQFYSSLLSGQAVSNATRVTSIKMLLNSHTAHPYYWAAFAAYGRP